MGRDRRLKLVLALCVLTAFLVSSVLARATELPPLLRWAIALVAALVVAAAVQRGPREEERPPPDRPPRGD